jgi:hypothetical protein
VTELWLKPEPLRITGSFVYLNGQQVGEAANYLAPGGHWNAIIARLRAARPAEEEAVYTAPVLAGLTQTLRHFSESPNWLSLGEALVASGRLSDARRLAFDRPIGLRASVADIELWPLSSHRGRLVLPVRVVAGGRDLEAALWLDATSEPSPLMIHPHQPLADIADLWARRDYESDRRARAVWRTASDRSELAEVPSIARLVPPARPLVGLPRSPQALA